MCKHADDTGDSSSNRRRPRAGGRLDIALKIAGARLSLSGGPPGSYLVSSACWLRWAGAARVQGVMTVVARGRPLRSGVSPVRFSSPSTPAVTVRASWVAGPPRWRRGSCILGCRKRALADDAVHAAAHGLSWLACNLAERGPLLLVVDDVHWADAASLRWLIALTRRFEDLPLGVLCAVRSGEPASDSDLLEELLAAAPDAPLLPCPLGVAAAQTLGRAPPRGNRAPPISA